MDEYERGFQDAVQKCHEAVAALIPADFQPGFQGGLGVKVQAWLEADEAISALQPRDGGDK